MSMSLKLVQKLMRRMKQMRKSAANFGEYDKMNKAEEVMADSPRVYKLSVSTQRRFDSKFGRDMVAQEPALAFRLNATTLERMDFGVSDFGIRATLPAGMIAAAQIRPNDYAEVMEGSAKGQMLRVVSVIDSTHLRLEDNASMNYAGAKEKTTIGCVADVAGSLDGTYFLIKSAANATSYYVWMDVDAGGNDPLAAGTAIPVSIASNSSAAVVAAAVAAALEANADFTAFNIGANVYNTNAAVGIATDAADFDSGFSIAVTQQGAAANPTVSESNIVMRFELSTVKKSYV